MDIFNDENVPAWATRILDSKGIDFQIDGLKWIVWDYFQIQFSGVDCNPDNLKNYFECFVSQLHSPQPVVPTNHSVRPQTPRYPTKRKRVSAITEFEQKYADYISDGDLLDFES